MNRPDCSGPLRRLLTAAAMLLLCTSTGGLLPSAAAAQGVVTRARRFAYGVPLDAFSPWPKFRRDAPQSGRGPIVPADSGRAPWVFQTGKGVFSSPVIDGEGTVYIGSADHYFYAIDRDGHLRWKFLTGEIIDSAALLDDQGRVIFGSGDGRLYALDRRSGTQQWAYLADDPSVNNAFIRWFEGNVAIGPDGVLYVPNDNFCTYAVGRVHGDRLWCWRTWDQTWSLPAFDPATNTLLLGNNFPFLRNTFALDAAGGARRWSARAYGSVVASPLLTTAGGARKAVVGAFDGTVRAYDPANGRELWQRTLRDHVYASAAEGADGTIIQPGADGSVYALRPDDGGIRWVFDTREPIRSSPAIDGNGNVYVGSGAGKLFVLNPDGTLRWAMRLIDDPRDDLNSSPALGIDAVVIGGESGGVFSVPYDYCLRPDAAADRRCLTRAEGGWPSEGASFVFTTSFGRYLSEPPTVIEANQPLTFSLVVRAHDKTQAALLDSDSVHVTLQPPVAAAVDVSGDRRFVTVVPRGNFSTAASRALTVRVEARYQDGGAGRLMNTNTNTIHDASGTFNFQVRAPAPAAFHLTIPGRAGDPATAWELYRLAAPLPTILPSYNQIGFDSIHYLIGLVEGDDRHAVAWVVGGRLGPAAGVGSAGTLPDGSLHSAESDQLPAGADDHGEVDPDSRVRFPLEVDLDGDVLTMRNEAGFTIEFNGFPLPFEAFRVAARVDGRGAAIDHAAINAKTTCGKIDFYGAFLQRLGYCNPSTDLLNVVGAAELRPLREEPSPPPGTLQRPNPVLNYYRRKSFQKAQNLQVRHSRNLQAGIQGRGEPATTPPGCRLEDCRHDGSAGRFGLRAAPVLGPVEGGERTIEETPAAGPAGVGEVNFRGDATSVTATLRGAALRAGAHNVGILLIDAATGRPLRLDYARQTTYTVSAGDDLESATIRFPPGSARGTVRAYLMVDNYPAASTTLALPASAPWPVTIAYRLRSATAAARSVAGRITRHVALTLLEWWGS